MQKTTLLLILLILLPILSISQSKWWEIKDDSFKINQNGYQKQVSFEFSEKSLGSVLENIPLRIQNKGKSKLINFPTIDGKNKLYYLKKVQILSIGLQYKYPELLSFIGSAQNNPQEKIRITYHPSFGLHGFIKNQNSETILIQRKNKNSSTIKYAKSENIQAFECMTDSFGKNNFEKSNRVSKNANDGNLRRYKLAVAASGEYSQFFLDGTETSDEERRVKVLAAMVSTMNRVNGIFERDFAVTMQIVDNNDSLIYLDASSDPFNPNGSLNTQLQNAIDNSIIGDQNYDVGHLFHVEGSVYGNAGCIACVCTSGSKGSAFTVHNDPSSDNFNLIVAHEFGHQFGGYHVQSSSNCRSGFNSEVEPGSGSTIMGYAGICPANVQEGPDDYFNYVDIRDVAVWTINNSNCAEVIQTNNTAPQLEDFEDKVIPISTPFVLESNATDPNSDDILSYCWEQNDPEDPFTSQAPLSTRFSGPLFRSRLPQLSNKRYFPKIEDIIAGNLTPTWEVLPSVSREMRFECTVRDNSDSGGQTNTKGISLSVDSSSGPFRVTSQNIPEEWIVGDQVSINWDVANTNSAPVSASLVNIYFSIDGGYTYPFILAEGIENNGSYSFNLTNIPSTDQGKLMIKASDNVFFAINSSNIKVLNSEFLISLTSNNGISICKSDNATYNLKYQTFLDFDEETIFTIEGLVQGLSYTFNPSSISGKHNSGTGINLTISGTNSLENSSYDFSIVGTSTSGIRKTIPLNFRVFEDSIDQNILLNPSNNDISIQPDTVFEWVQDFNVDNYMIEISETADFSIIVDQASLEINNYSSQNLNYNTTYYWRITAQNPCDINQVSEVFSFQTACETPQEFTASNIGSNYVSLEWVDSSSNTWEIQYGSDGFTLGNGLIVESENTTFEITELSSNTSYDFYMRSKCSANDVNGSSWIGPLSITTSVDFCNGDRFYDSGGANGNYRDNEFSQTLISPKNIGERVRVIFERFETENCCDYLRVYDGIDNTAELISENRGFITPESILARNETGSLFFEFRSDGSVTGAGWDARVICEPKPNCQPISNFNVVMENPRSVDFTWDADQTTTNSWEIEYGPRGFNEGTGVKITAEDTVFTVGNLEPITDYDLYIKGNCTEGGVSDISGPFSFTTACDVFQAPFLESFENFNVLPECWEQEGSENWQFNTFANNDASNAGDRNRSNNTQYAWISGAFPRDETQRVLYTPIIDISTLTNPSIQFSVFSSNTIDHSYNSFKAELYDGNSWNTVTEISNNTNGWIDIVIDLADYNTTSNIQIRFIVIENNPEESYYNDILVDEIKVDELPSCLNPQRLIVDEIKWNSTSAYWESNGTETNWELLYGRRGFSVNNGVSQVVDSNNFEIQNLSPETDYELYVRAVCGIGDVSEYIGPIYFKTTCQPEIAPFVEVFDGSFNRDCWKEEGTSGNWNFSRYFDSETGDEIEDGSNNSSFYLWKLNDTSNRSSYYSTSYIDVSGLSIPSFQYLVYSKETISAKYDTLNIEIFNNGEWTLIDSFTGNSFGWRKMYVDLSGVNLDRYVKIRFSVNENPDLNFENHYILLDNITFDELPSCFEPYGLEVGALTKNSAEIFWKDDLETSWEIEYGNLGFSQGNGTLVQSDLKTYLLENLESNNSYEFYVRSKCSDQDFSNWVGPFKFKTAADYCFGDRFYDSGGIDNPYSNNERTQTLIAPENAEDRVRVSFTSFRLESCCDYLRIYDGPDNNANLIGIYNGTNSPGTLYSTHPSGSLYFEFSSDSSVIYEGWEAEVFCEPKPSCDPPINLMVNQITGNSAQIVWDDQEEIDEWQIEYGETGFLKGTGEVITSNTNSLILQNLAEQTGYDVYLQSLCDNDIYSNPVKTIFFTTENCRTVSNMDLVSSTANSLILTWDLQNGNETSWIIEYGEAGFNLGSGISQQIQTNLLELSELDSGTSYDFYIKTICSNEEALWSGPYTYRTSVDCSLIDENNEIIKNGGFECGILGDWVSRGPGSNEGCRMNFTVLDNSNNVCVIVPEITPTQGQYAAFTSFDGSAGDTYELEQLIEIPNNINVAEKVDFTYDFVVEYDIIYGTPLAERELSAALYDLDNNLVFDIHSVSFGIDPSTGNISYTFVQDILEQLIPYSGQKLLIRFSAFVPDTSTGPSKALIDNVSMVIEYPLSTDENEFKDGEVLLIPNPNNGSFQLKNARFNNLKEIKVFDLIGNLVYQKSFQDDLIDEKIQLPFSQEGIYLIEIISDTSTSTKKFVIKR